MDVSRALLRSEVPDAWKGRIVAGTGHRPNRLLGYGEHADRLLDRFAGAWIRTLEPSRVLTGMALGFDLSLARASIHLGVAFTAAVPFEGQDALWPDGSRREYQRVLARAEAVVVVSPGGYAPAKLLRRNQWLVEHCTLLAALLKPGAHGGTANCVRYASAAGRETVHMWRSWEAFVAHAGARATPPLDSPV